MNLRNTLEKGSELDIVGETHDETGEWPYDPSIIEREVTGTLAERVRNRFGEAEDTKVTILESTFYGGYSEYTQENNLTFEIRCGEHSITIEPHYSTEGWTELPANDTVFAKLQTWLLASEKPEKLWRDMVEQRDYEVYPGRESKGWFLKEGSLLYRVASKNSPVATQIRIAELSTGNWGLAIESKYYGAETSIEYVSLHVDSSLSLRFIENRRAVLSAIADRFCVDRW